MQKTHIGNRFNSTTTFIVSKQLKRIKYHIILTITKSFSLQ